MTVDAPGYCDDCVFVTTFHEGGYSQFSCQISLPAVTLQFRREKPIFPTYTNLEAMRFELVNVSAKAQVNLIFESKKFSAIHITRLIFFNLYDRLRKKAIKANQVSGWKTAVISRVQAIFDRAYFQDRSLKCYA
nr:unnamed protein product [Spirometra erinaceieuropaei]